MQLGRVIGRTTATVKHPALAGWRLLIVQPLLADAGPDGDPQIAIDTLGAALGSRVIISADGAVVREMMGSRETPVRWAVIGHPDD